MDPELRRTALALIRATMENDDRAAWALLSADLDGRLLFLAALSVAGGLVMYAAGDQWRPLMDDVALQEAER